MTAMTEQHEWPTAPIIEAAWVTPMTEETAPTYTWTRVRDGVYYSRYLNYVARKGEGHFTNVTEYWPHDYRKDEVQQLPDRDEIKKALERQLGSFLAHDPAYPDRFWGQAADAVLALFTATAPAKPTWHVGDTINTPEEADTLPGKTIIHDNRQYYAQKYKNQWFGPGHPYAIEAREFECPLTIIWLPEEGEA